MNRVQSSGRSIGAGATRLAVLVPLSILAAVIASFAFIELRRGNTDASVDLQGSDLAVSPSALLLDPSLEAIDSTSRVWFASGQQVVPESAVIVLDTTNGDEAGDIFGVWVFDTDGRQLGVIETSFGPHAFVRATPRELLVVDIPADPANPFVPLHPADKSNGYVAHLTSYDLEDHLRPKWRIELSQWSSYTIYRSGSLILTNDQRYVFLQDTNSFRDVRGVSQRLGLHGIWS